MDKMEKTHELENKLTLVQADVSYLKEKVDKVEIKLESMDNKTDQLMNDLPVVFKSIMENYIARSEYDLFVKRMEKEFEKSTRVDKRVTKLEGKGAVIAGVFGVLLFILSFGETISKWLTSLVHQP